MIAHDPELSVMNLLLFWMLSKNFNSASLQPAIIANLGLNGKFISLNI